MIQSWAENFSSSVWNRIKNSKENSNIKLYEVTVTQNMIHELFELNNKKITIEESTNEAVNGNDLEIIFINNLNFEHYAVQSKISNYDELYKSIDHNKNNRYQLNDLISYANDIQAIPLYFFYSHTSKYNGQELYNNSIKYDQYGVGVLCAKTIYWDYFNWDPDIYKFKKIPSVIDIINEDYSFTFKEFITEQYIRNKIKNNIFEPMAFVSSNMGFLKNRIGNNIEGILKSTKWNKIKKLSSENKLIENDSKYNTFSPKYRIIIDCKI